MGGEVNFEEIYRSNYKSLRAAANNLIGDKDASHDIVQEVFVKLWHRKDDLSDILNLKAYLYRAVVNSSLTYLSNNKKKVQFADLQFTSEKSDSGVMVKELEHKIQEALSKLPPKCKAVFVLSRFEERKNKEIAEILGLSIKTVENQMGIALKKLREDLKPYLGKDVLALSFGLGLTAIVLRSLLTVSAQ